MWKVQTISESPDAVTFFLSGRLRVEQVDELRTLLDAETRKITFDMKEVDIVDWVMVAFLSHCAACGIELANCPPYIEEWIAKARALRSKSNPSTFNQEETAEMGKSNLKVSGGYDAF